MLHFRHKWSINGALVWLRVISPKLCVVRAEYPLSLALFLTGTTPPLFLYPWKPKQRINCPEKERQSHIAVPMRHEYGVYTFATSLPALTLIWSQKWKQKTKNKKPGWSSVASQDCIRSKDEFQHRNRREHFYHSEHRHNYKDERWVHTGG